MTGLAGANGRHAAIQAYFPPPTNDKFFFPLYELTVLSSPRRLKRLRQIMMEEKSSLPKRGSELRAKLF